MQTTEQQFSDIVLRILAAHPYGRASHGSLRKEIIKNVTLTPEDLAPSTTRPGEQMWQQIVRNITSHHKTPGNYVHDGYLKRVFRGLAITDSGRKKIGA